MVPDLRILFLVGLFATIILYIVHFGTVLELRDFRALITAPLFLLALGLTIGSFAALLFRIDPTPFIREGAYQLSFQQLISIEDAIPPRLADNLAIEHIERLDTDGDEFKEWVICYTFDTRESDKSPIGCAIYDSDRGNPPVVFPYVLRAPSRDYLSEDALEAISFRLEPVTEDQNGPEGQDLDELLAEGEKTLAIFRFNENSREWDFPRNAPPRYETIGFFRGNGGVQFDEESSNVTVLDRDGFERSQLAVRSVYALNPATNTYWDQFYDITEFDVQLRAPIFSSVDFFPGPPDDIVDTAFPEKTVLGFYVSTCAGEDESLCRNFQASWEPEDFLTGDALSEFNSGNASYFGLDSFNSTQDLAISHLQYYPSLETDPDLLETGGGRDVVTGEEAQRNVVDLELVANNAPIQPARFHMELVNGQWKIALRLPLDAPLDMPSQNPAPSPQ